MKNIFFILFAFALFLSVLPPPLQASPHEGSSIVFQTDQLAPAAMAQETGGVAVEQGDPALNVEVPEDGVPVKDFLLENWSYLLVGLLAFIEIFVRLTPTQKDDSIFNWVYTLINAILPKNKKEGGGTFGVSPK